MKLQSISLYYRSHMSYDGKVMFSRVCFCPQGEGRGGTPHQDRVTPSPPPTQDRGTLLPSRQDRSTPLPPGQFSGTNYPSDHFTWVFLNKKAVWFVSTAVLNSHSYTIFSRNLHEKIPQHFTLTFCCALSYCACAAFSSDLTSRNWSSSRIIS